MCMKCVVLVYTIAEFSSMAFDSEISLQELEDSDWDGAVSSSILIRAQRTAETIDWNTIPEDQVVLGSELLAFVKEDKVELPKLELESVKSPANKKPKHGPLADATSRFRNSSSVTDDNKLATISKGFVPDTGVNGGMVSILTMKCPKMFLSVETQQH